jgi:glycine cleavage system H protein
MSNYKLDEKAKNAETHEWVRLEDGIAVIGISDAAQDMLSDVVYVDLPEAGRQVEAGEAVAVVESVKAAEDVLSPVSGTVVAVNADLADMPELVNEKPYEAWFFKVQPAESLDTELAKLMDSSAYDAFVDENEH